MNGNTSKNYLVQVLVVPLQETGGVSGNHPGTHSFLLVCAPSEFGSVTFEGVVQFSKQ